VNRWFVVVALILCVARIHAQDQSPAQPGQVAAGTLVLDGAKHPELFPEWFRWEGFFTSLVGAPLSGVVVHGMKLPPLHEQLGLIEADLAIVLNEGKGFQQYRQEMEAQVRSLNARMKAEGKREKDIIAAVHQVDLTYRYKILDASDRLHAQLSADSLAAVTRRIDQQVQGTTMYLRGSAKETFQLPR
jgi:hypothetical protein